MSFLSSIYLWLIPLASLPILIHLFFNKKFKIVEYSSIQFLKEIEVDSIKKIKIIEIFLLIIRTLIIVFLILMISKPVITNKNYSLLLNNNDQIYCIISLDDSFSMLQANTDTKVHNIFGNKISSIVNSLPDKSRLKIFSLTNNELLYDGISNDFILNDLSSKITFMDIDLFAFTKSLKKDYAFNKELHILTDMQSYAFKDVNKSILDDWTIFVHDCSYRIDNLSIIKARVVNDITSINDEIEIEVKIQNNGINDVENALLVLNIDNINVGQQEVNIVQGETISTSFKTIIDSPGNHRGHIEIVYDKILSDNIYYFDINFPEKINIALLSENISDYRYIENSLLAINSQINNIHLLNSGNTMTNSGDIINSDVLFIFGYKYITDHHLYNSIYDQTNNGGIVYIFPNAKDSITTIEEDLFDIFTINPNLVKYEENKIGFSQSIFSENILDPDILLMLDSKQKNDEMFSIYKYFSFPLEENSIMQINSRSIWASMAFGKGNVNIIGFSPDLSWTDLPIRAPFIKLINYVINSGPNDNSIMAMVGDSYLKNDEFYTIHAPNSKPYIHIVNSDKQYTYDIPGQYEIRSDDWREYISVNPSFLELNYNKISKEELMELFNNLIIVESKENNEILFQSARLGIELWKYCLYLVIIFIILEMAISNQFYKNK